MPNQARNSAPLPVQRSLRAVGEHCASWRKLRGLTEMQLAERADISRGTVSNLEKGESVSLETLLRVTRVLGVLDQLTDALDPLKSDIGRLRADERLPRRVRPRDLTGKGP